MKVLAISIHRRKKVGVECTPAQYIEIEADFEFYRFYTAFISKNNLFPPPELASQDDADEEVDLVKAKKVSAFMMGIERRTRNKALPGEISDR